VDELAEKLDEELVFGTDSLQISVPVICQVNEVVELVDYSRPEKSHHYKGKFLLSAHQKDRFSAAGIVSAAPESDFAKSTGTFAFVPSSRERLATGSIGEVLMGIRDPIELAHRCENALVRAPSAARWDPFVRVPILKELRDHWGVNGGLQVRIPSSPEALFPNHSVEWIVDTGAGYDRGLYVTREVYFEVVHGIHMAGAVVDDYFYRWRTAVHKCTKDRLAEFPILEISVGRSPDTQLTLSYGPEKYLMWTGSDPTICYLKLDPSDVNASPSVRLLGMGFLSETVTIFSRSSESVSFCKIDH
jgi:hypothetical protein